MEAIQCLTQVQVIVHVKKSNTCERFNYRFKTDLGFATETEIKQFDKEARAEIDEAVAKAHGDPHPDPSELFTNIYVKGTEPPIIRGREREEFAVMNQ